MYNAIKEINENVLTYEELEKSLIKVIPFVSEFFEKVLVMDNDEEVKLNRITLLNTIKQKFAKIADFSKIVF